MDPTTGRIRPGKLRHYLAETGKAGGYYVEDCWPWAIKPGCDRADCPMRTLLLPPEAKETYFFIKCNPPGELADFLITVKTLSEV